MKKKRLKRNSAAKSSGGMATRTGTRSAHEEVEVAAAELPAAMEGAGTVADHATAAPPDKITIRKSSPRRAWLTWLLRSLGMERNRNEDDGSGLNVMGAVAGPSVKTAVERYDIDDETSQNGPIGQRPGGSDLADPDALQPSIANPASLRERLLPDTLKNHRDPTSSEELYDICNEKLPSAFAMRGGWVCFIKQVKDKPAEFIPVCSPMVVTCITTNEDHAGYAREVVFSTPHGRLQRELIKEADLVQGGRFVKNLADLGLRCARGQEGKVATLIQSFPVEASRSALTKTGWAFGPVPAFRLQDGVVIGADPQTIAETYAGPTFRQSYRTEALKWCEGVKPMIEGNRIPTMVIALQLAGPVLRLIDENGFSVHLDGMSSVGKSSAARLGHAVFSRGDLMTAEATANGLEPVIARNNDLAFVLDELRPRAGMGKDSYGVANGRGKLRATANGGAARQNEWKTILMTTGEITPSEASQEPVQTGQRVRHPVIAVQGHKYRLFDTIGPFDSDTAFVPAIKTVASQHAGSLGPAFIEALCQDLPASITRAKQLVELEHGRLIALAAGRWTSPQHHRMLRNFAIIYAAGVLAIDFGLAPWTLAGLTEAIRHCAFRALRQFDNPDFFTLMKAERVVETFWMHFEECEHRFITPQGGPDPLTADIGWKDDAYACISREVFEGWFGNPTEAATALKRLVQHGLVIPGDGRHMLRKLPRWTGETGRAVCVDLSRVPL